MIDSISISNCATFSSTPENFNDLKKFNYIFGPNGSGKTTISKVIAGEENFLSCNIIWKNSTRLQPMVYNRDFIEINFNQASELKGVFTLGETNIDTTNKINQLKSDIDKLNRKKTNLELNLINDNDSTGLKLELESTVNSFKESCWAQKLSHQKRFYGAFKGFMDSKEKFKEKVLYENDNNTEHLIDIAELTTRASTIYETTPALETVVTVVDGSVLLAHETNSTLSKRVVGKDDVDIAAIINKLENSDWVKEGIKFYNNNNKICPFCQQTVPDTFEKALADYFDESFEKDIKDIDKLIQEYEADCDKIQNQLVGIINIKSKFIDNDKITKMQQTLTDKITINLQRLHEKIKEPSRSIRLERTSSTLADIETLIKTANAEIAAHNNMVENIKEEKRILTSQVWKYIIEVELKNTIQSYSQTRGSLLQKIERIENEILQTKSDIKQLDNQINDLEKSITSIQPTIDEINALLYSFGFHNFKLDKAVCGTCYKLIRSNGEDAKETLSEGEKTFITFLYFYHLLKGSESSSGVTIDRIAVFDDPVSSLDSDILFIVSSLIRRIIDDVRNNVGHIKQVFVLTHNVYFHKEVTFKKSRPSSRTLPEESFWVVRKTGEVSHIERHSSNPVKSTYDLLWEDVRNPRDAASTIQNSFRRILENYFKVLGGTSLEDIPSMFEGNDKLICNSLISWVHEGSHSIHDGLHIVPSESMLETYKRVFKEIFYKTGHNGHYDMMIGSADSSS